MKATDFIKSHPNPKLRTIIPEGVEMAKDYIAKFSKVEEAAKHTGIAKNTIGNILNGECSYRTWVTFFEVMTNNLQPAA